MLTYDLSARGKTPIYEYLCGCLRRDIYAGRLAVGEKLPGRRSLAEHLGVSEITVNTAYMQLAAEGCLVSVPRRGMYVAARPLAPGPDAPREARSAEAGPRWRLDLRSGRIEEALFPSSAWARLTRRVLSEEPRALVEGVPHEGLYALREAVSDYLRGYKGLDAPPERIIIGAGSEFLYLMLAQLFSGRSFALEDPGYPKIRETYAACGIECLPVPLDAHGVSPAALAASGAGALHISPAHQYPSGLVTPMPRRQELLDWAERTGGYIVEDDYDSELGFTARPLPTLAGIDRAGRVLYMTTFSQTISPGLRVSCLVLPEALTGLWRERVGFYASAVPNLEQHVLARFIASGGYERHLSRLRKTLRERRAAVLEAFRSSAFAPRCEIAEPAAGLHFLMRADTPLTDAELKRRAGELGVRLALLSDFAFDERSAEPHTLVINYAGLNGERLGAAVGLLERIIC